MGSAGRMCALCVVLLGDAFASDVNHGVKVHAFSILREAVQSRG